MTTTEVAGDRTARAQVILARHGVLEFQDGRIDPHRERQALWRDDRKLPIGTYQSGAG